MGLEEYFKEKIRRKSFAKITAKKSRAYGTNAAKSGQLAEKSKGINELGTIK